MNPVAAFFSAGAAWASAHPDMALALVLATLTVLSNGAMRLGHASWAVGIGKLVDLLSPLARSNAAGTFKPPILTVKDGRVALSFSQPQTTAEAKEAQVDAKTALAEESPKEKK